MKKLTLYVIIIPSILIISTITGIMIVNTIPQAITVQVMNQKGQPLHNVEVQGILAIPPSLGNGLRSVFNGKTTINGVYTVTDLVSLRAYTSAWVQYQGTENATKSNPDILVLLTYNTTAGLYTKEISIGFSTVDFLQGQSFMGKGMLDLAKEPSINRTQLTNKGSFSPVNSKIHNIINPDVTRQGTGWLINQLTEKNWPEKGTGNIPLAIVQTDAHSYAGLMTSLVGTVNYNVGIITNIVAKNPSYSIARALWSTSAAAEDAIDVRPNTTAYLAIEGQIDGANLNYCSWNKGITYCHTNVTLYMAGIVNVQIANRNLLTQGGLYNNKGANQYNMTTSYQNYTYKSYEQVDGLNSSQGAPQQEIYSDNLMNETKGLIEPGTGVVNIGSLLATERNTSGILQEKIDALTVTLTSKAGGEMTAMQFDGKQGYTINVEYMESMSAYNIQNGKTVQLRMFNIKLVSNPI